MELIWSASTLSMHATIDSLQSKGRTWSCSPKGNMDCIDSVDVATWDTPPAHEVRAGPPASDQPGGLAGLHSKK